MSRVISIPLVKPWFVAASPWPWWNSNASKRAISIGNPQNVLQTRSAVTHGFTLTASVGISGSNATGATGANYPATVGAILNLSAAAMASAPAFGSRE